MCLKAILARNAAAPQSGISLLAVIGKRSGTWIIAHAALNIEPLAPPIKAAKDISMRKRKCMMFQSNIESFRMAA
jgi:hypothetical protein